jgi:hypothetical protein
MSKDDNGNGNGYDAREDQTSYADPEEVIKDYGTVNELLAKKDELKRRGVGEEAEPRGRVDEDSVDALYRNIAAELTSLSGRSEGVLEQAMANACWARESDLSAAIYAFTCDKLGKGPEDEGFDEEFLERGRERIQGARTYWRDYIKGIHGRVEGMEARLMEGEREALFWPQVDWGIMRDMLDPKRETSRPFEKRTITDERWTGGAEQEAREDEQWTREDFEDEWYVLAVHAGIKMPAIDFGDEKISLTEIRDRYLAAINRVREYLAYVDKIQASQAQGT